MYRSGMVTVALYLVGLLHGGATAAVAHLAPRNDRELEVLKLDEITGTDQIQAVIERLSRERTRQQLKELVQAAVALAQQKDSPLGYNAAYIVLHLCDEIHDFQSAEVLYRFLMERARLIKSTMREFELRELMMSLAMRTRQFAQAERLGREILEMEASTPEMESRKIFVTLQMIIVYAYLNRLDDANNILAKFKAVRGLDEHPLILQREAWLLRFTGQYGKAADLYQKALAQANNEKVADFIRYQLGSLYAEMNDVDKATEYLQVLLKKEPDNPTYNNDLGYIWVDHDRNLDQAEKMIRKALEKEPENAAYLDSLAWVYYKKKQYAEAKKLLLQAVALPDGQHAELYDHLGDVHLALGEREQAVAAWKKAIELASPSHRDQQLKREAERKIRKVQAP
ncbi:MAG: tetratricopeptide repeat protein [Gemmatales bacterium]|nr:tetratricopeptide repeat protein [Gemmatales bacterium]MCS7159776.1 tetratricopeptide repeat protein [Gemmatales bacterium]MDW8174974.1 tetratricopeptide repeat protein [Gemmatales bacterium]MDW8221371.1 tetratricopeptide repeat protein [Gemmatales bacterium]